MDYTMDYPMDYPMKHARLLCPSPTPGACSNSRASVGDAIQPSHPLVSLFSPAFNLSQHQGLFHESVLHIRWPKYWSFSFSISTSSEDSGLFSFRIDLFDLLAVQGTLKSLLQHHSSKASILWHSGFFVAVGASLVAQMVKRLPEMWETWVRFLGREDPLEKEMAIHSSTLAWKIPWTEEPDRLQSMGLQTVHGVAKSRTRLQFHFHFFCGPTLISIHDYWKNHSSD